MVLNGKDIDNKYIQTYSTFFNINVYLDFVFSFI